jgi:hypothetical protein
MAQTHSRRAHGTARRLAAQEHSARDGLVGQRQERVRRRGCGASACCCLIGTGGTALGEPPTGALAVQAARTDEPVTPQKKQKKKTETAGLKASPPLLALLRHDAALAVPAVRCLQVDCAVGAWGGWSACAADTGRQERTRPIVTPPSSDGRACPTLGDATDCAVACVLGAWAPWGECSASCGGGQRVRRRAVEVPAKNGGEACGSTDEADACNTELCGEKARRRDLKVRFSRAQCGRVCSQALRFKVGDDVIDQDGERCRVVGVDAKDFEKPYELEYPNGSKFWAAESSIRRHKEKVPLSGRRWMLAR